MRIIGECAGGSQGSPPSASPYGLMSAWVPIRDQLSAPDVGAHRSSDSTHSRRTHPHRPPHLPVCALFATSYSAHQHSSAPAHGLQVRTSGFFLRSLLFCLLIFLSPEGDSARADSTNCGRDELSPSPPLLSSKSSTAGGSPLVPVSSPTHFRGCRATRGRGLCGLIYRSSSRVVAGLLPSLNSPDLSRRGPAGFWGNF